MEAFWGPGNPKPVRWKNAPGRCIVRMRAVHDTMNRSMETRAYQIDRESRYLRRFQHRADEIAHLIVNTDIPWIDISIAIEQLREEGRRLFPLKMDLFELIFVSRFKRLWHQWRASRE